jgi:aerobic carbon-monoxide dehydrogenase large subunit
VEMAHRETEAPLNPLGIKGVGEAGCIPTGAAFAQAIEDALPHLGLEIREIPLSPDRLFALIREAEARGGSAAAAGADPSTPAAATA